MKPTKSRPLWTNHGQTPLKSRGRKLRAPNCAHTELTRVHKRSLCYDLTVTPLKGCYLLIYGSRSLDLDSWPVSIRICDMWHASQADSLSICTEAQLILVVDRWTRVAIAILDQDRVHVPFRTRSSGTLHESWLGCSHKDLLAVCLVGAGFVGISLKLVHFHRKWGKMRPKWPKYGQFQWFSRLFGAIWVEFTYFRLKNVRRSRKRFVWPNWPITAFSLFHQISEMNKLLISHSFHDQLRGIIYSDKPRNCYVLVKKPKGSICWAIKASGRLSLLAVVVDP